MKRLFEKLFSGEERKENSILKPRYFIIIGLVGVLLLLISSIFQDNEPEQTEQPLVTEQEINANEMGADTTTSEVKQLERSYEEDIVTMINQIQGVTEAEVMVNLDSSDVKVYERNTISGTQTTSEEDQSGGMREVEDRTEDSQVVLIRQGDTEQPILVQTKRPDVRGVFVVAKGAEQASVKSAIIEAISSVLDVPSHRISVMPKE